MIDKINFKEACEKEKTLYGFLGESLCAVQILEDALSHLIVLKKTEPHEKEEADKLLKEQQFYTFGRSIRIAKKESLLPKTLEIELTNLLVERNWLIHESITNNKRDFKSESFFIKLFERTKQITLKAHELQISIELHLIEYCEKKGINMFKIKNKMNTYYGS